MGLSLRDRGIEIKRREQIDLMRVAGRLVGETLELLRAAVRPGVTTGELDRLAEENIRSPRRHPVVPRLQPPAVPGDDLRVGQRPGRARHPGRPGAGRRRRHLDRLRRHRRRLARRRGHHGGRRRGRRRRTPPDGGDRGVAVARAWPRPASAAGSATSPTAWRPTSAARATTASSRTTSGTASARRCTSRPTCRTSAGRAAAPSWSRAWRWPWSRWSPSAATPPSLEEDEWTVSTADGSRAAHFEHTFTLTPNGPWVLTALDGGEARLTAMGVPFGGR